MDDPGRVRLAESLPDLRGDVDGITDRQRPAVDPLLERLPLVVGHHEIKLPILGLVDLVDRHCQVKDASDTVAR